MAEARNLIAILVTLAIDALDRERESNPVPITDGFDIIIVGAGTAGCLLANRLSADPKRRVLLVEAGGSDRYPWIHVPVGYLYCIDNPRTDWCFRTENEPALGGRSLLYPRGRTLGGSSSINGMIYMRGQASDYDGWATSTGLNEWAWNSVLEDFLTHEDSYRVGAEPSNTHAAGGEWRVEKQRLHWDILDAYARAACEAGIPRTDDFNGGDNEGVSYFDVNQRRGFRWNAAKAFLRPVRHRKNLTVATNVEVAKLSIATTFGKPPRCDGIILRTPDGTKIVNAREEVILSAGSIGSPTILMRSGIGPGDHLRGLDIPVVCDRPGVGGNLQDHLQLRTVLRVENTKTLNERANSWIGWTAMGLEYALRRSGPLSMSPSQLGIFTRSHSHRAHPNLQFHVQPLSLDAFGQPLHKFPGITSSVCNLNPTSRGTVRLRSPNAKDPPRISPNYLTTDDDIEVAAASIRIARNIAAQPALAPFNPKEVKPGTGESDVELAAAAGEVGTTIFHPVGTAKMGRADDPHAVVDPRLKVLGCSGLRVVDASIMPTITSGNTNSPTLMIAEKAARWIEVGL